MTGTQLALCDPADDLTWLDNQPDNHTPTPFDLRQTEMRDLRGQNAGPGELWTAHTVPTGSYL